MNNSEAISVNNRELLLRDSTLEWDDSFLVIEEEACLKHLPPAISLKNVSKRYKNFNAVDNVSFMVPSGSIVGLLGGNGAGKTTTISMIMGLITPSFGSIHVLGHDMAKTRHQALASMNFQSPYVLMPSQLTVRENLNIFARLYNVKELEKRIDHLVYEFGLKDLLNLQTGRLSAGQKTRVSLAKALLNKPQLLLLDEPTASLDPDRAEWIRQLLRNYQRENKATILISSHNMDEVDELCDYVVIMDRGRIIKIGTPLELTQHYECQSMGEVFLTIMRQSY
jgi:ABC-2 type transport system ATP-binding protein